MPLRDAQRIPTATYRLQLNSHFTFADAERLVPYLAELGISDCYCSPIFQSSPGSTHGYDVGDFSRIDTELGGEDGFKRLAATLRAHDMGVLVDFVPNHMGIGGSFNAWWKDVLEFGPASKFAGVFDIQWDLHKFKGAPRVLVPILEDHYGRVLEKKLLTIACDDGELTIRYHDLQFPLRPRSYREILRALAAETRSKTESAALAGAADEIVDPADRSSDERAMGDVAPTPLGHPAEFVRKRPPLGALISAGLARLNERIDFLDAIITDQHYRLARWQSGAHETNYRRFFAIGSLIGVRMEKSEVFERSHAVLQQLIREGNITGLRIDHIDGLFNPHQYLHQLQALSGGDGAGAKPMFVLVEKILAADESLPRDWPVHGTTGYEFASQLARVLSCPETEAAFTRTYEEFTGLGASWDEIVRKQKRLILEEMFANVVVNLAGWLDGILDDDRNWRDLTGHELFIAIRELIVALDIYRTYREPGQPCSDTDRRRIAAASERASKETPGIDAEVFDLLRRALCGDYPDASAPESFRERIEWWALAFQQYTGAVMAKSVEDTSFYVFNRLVGLNEVGADPAAFGGTVAEFHDANARRQKEAPLCMLTTSTHDTKFSEDARARLYALSELPEDWNTWLADWSRMNTGHRSLVDGRHAPDANEEYRFYQSLLAAWPFDFAEVNDAFVQRMRDYLRKAISEAKANTHWIHTNQPWLDACDQFVTRVLDRDANAEFLATFHERAVRLGYIGITNSLAQVVLKLTSPGIPDIYQGNEIPDFSLVDPDNRRPVDFAQRRALLDSLASRSPAELVRDWRDGALKLHVTRTLLHLRREHPRLFAFGDYTPLVADGVFAKNLVAFSRTHENESITVIVPRLAAHIGNPPLGAVWDDTTVSLPFEGAACDDLLNRATRRWQRGPVRVAEILTDVPVAVLVRSAT